MSWRIIPRVIAFVAAGLLIGFGTGAIQHGDELAAALGVFAVVLGVGVFAIGAFA